MGRRLLVVCVTFLCVLLGLWGCVEMGWVDQTFFSPSSSSSSPSSSFSGVGWSRARKEMRARQQQSAGLVVPGGWVEEEEEEEEDAVEYWRQRDAAFLVVP